MYKRQTISEDMVGHKLGEFAPTRTFFGHTPADNKAKPAEAEALTTYGIIGIKVWIYKGEVFAKEFSQETNKVTPKEGKQ